MSCTAQTSTSLSGCQAASSGLFAPLWEVMHPWQANAMPCPKPRCVKALQSENSGPSQAEADEAAAKKLWRA